MRSSLDPKYRHLEEDLHVEISVFSSPALAYSRIAHALTEIRKFLVPDCNDAIRQKQREELDRIQEGQQHNPTQVDVKVNMLCNK